MSLKLKTNRIMSFNGKKLTSFRLSLEKQTVGYSKEVCFSLYYLFLCVFEETTNPNMLRLLSSLFKAQNLEWFLLPLLVKTL